MNISHIRNDADRYLQEDGGSFSKLVLIHTAVITGASLLLMLVSWLSSLVTPEGGLSNMNAQNLLSTGQILLQLICTIATPFWEAGLIYCAMQRIRNKEVTTGNLTAGFHHMGPIFSSLIIRGLIYFVFSIACYYASSIIMSIVPIPTWIVNEVTAFTKAPVLPLSSGVQIYLIILSVIFMGSLCVVLIPKIYLHRLVEYRIMDSEPCGGLQAVLHSRILMKGNRRKLFLLDLSFWWVYLLEAATVLLSISYLFIPGLDTTAVAIASWVFPILALLARLALYYFVKPKLAISYALFYENVFEESLKNSDTSAPKQISDTVE